MTDLDRLKGYAELADGKITEAQLDEAARDLIDRLREIDWLARMDRIKDVRIPL